MSLETVFNYFANSLWQVPLLALGCWCALRLVRASARVQYGMWVLTLLLSVGLPWRGVRLPAETSAVTPTSDAIVAGEPMVAAPVRALPSFALRIQPGTRDLLAEIYLALTLLCVLKLLGSHVALRRLVVASDAARLAPWQEDLAAELGAKAGVIRVLPPGHGTPRVAGLWRPQVLLPEALLEDAPEALRAVLAHELAHVCRRDTVVNLLLRATALPVAYHPATAWLQRRIQHARELLCDDVAASAMRSPNAYAQVLLRLALQLVHTGGETHQSSVGLFARTSTPLLEERIMNLIAPPAPLRTADRVLRVTGAAALLCAAVAAVSVVHLTPSVFAAEHSSPIAAAVGTPPAIPPVDAKAGQDSSAYKPLRFDNGSAFDAMPLKAKVRDAKATLRSAEFHRQLSDLAKMSGGKASEYRKDSHDLLGRLNSPIATERLKAADEVTVMEFGAALMDSTKGHPALRRRLEDAVRQGKLQRQADAGIAQAPASTPKLLAEAKTPKPLRTWDQDDPYAGAVRVSGGVMAGAIVSRVQPIYPEIAKAAKVEGAVVLRALIGEDGTVRQLNYVSGPEMLKSAAIDAVRYWVYKPFLLNGQPTPVDTTITITFSFGG